MIDLAGDLAAILHDDCGFAVDAVYQPLAAASFPLRVLRRAPDLVTEFGSARLRSPTATFVVSAADVVAPAPGDRIIIGPATHIVQGDPIADDERLTWIVDTRPGS